MNRCSGCGQPYTGRGFCGECHAAGQMLPAHTTNVSAPLDMTCPICRGEADYCAECSGKGKVLTPAGPYILEFFERWATE